jgi:hypothetical protein
LLNQKVGEASREIIVHSAYKCVSSNKVFKLLQAKFNTHRGLRLWRILRLITKPVLNSRLLKRIACRHSNFRKAKINPLPPVPQTQLNNEYLVDIMTAWSRLCSVSPLTSELQKLYHFNVKFKLNCAQPLVAMPKSSYYCTMRIMIYSPQVLTTLDAARRVACYVKLSSKIYLSQYLPEDIMVFVIPSGQFHSLNLRTSWIPYSFLRIPSSVESRCT